MSDPNRFISTCLIPVNGKPCGTQFAVSSLAVPIIGKTLDERIAQIVKEGPLANHIAGKHANLLQPMISNMYAFYGLQMLSCYEHTDPVLLSKIDEARRAVHHRSLGPMPSRKEIRYLAEAAGFKGAGADKAVELCRQLIAYVCELRPDQQQPVEVSPLVNTNGSPLT